MNGHLGITRYLRKTLSIKKKIDYSEGKKVNVRQKQLLINSI